jgi:hypothetical protein
VIARLSPLQQYFAAHGRSGDELSLISQQLFDHALVVRQESKSIVDLHRRFTADKPLNEGASRALSELLIRHRAKLVTALDGEENMAVEIMHSTLDRTPDPALSSTVADPVLLNEVSERNLAFCKELISGSDGLRAAQICQSRWRRFAIVSMDRLWNSCL